MGKVDLEEMSATKIDWKSEESHVLLNPRFSSPPKGGIKKLQAIFAQFPGHIWVTTSGTTQQMNNALRFVGLSKTAFGFSAESVNRFLESSSSDRWLCCLPLFHVGGLGIMARAFHSGAKVVFMHQWNAVEFARLLDQEKCTLTSLVPAQVFDLVKQEIHAPKYVRTVLVGAGALNAELQGMARRLGWPVIASYGMTECASTIAIQANASTSSLVLLEHIQAKIDNKGVICLKSPSLFSVKAEVSEDEVLLEDTKRDGWYHTGDHGEMSGRELRLCGREEDFIKIGGESVLFSKLEACLEEVKTKMLFKGDCALVKIPDERLGFVIHLAVAESDLLATTSLKEAFNAKVLPFEKIREVHRLDSIPRSALKKVLKTELLQKLNLA